MYLRPPVSNNPAFEAAVILEHLLQRALALARKRVVDAAATTRPQHPAHKGMAGHSGIGGKPKGSRHTGHAVISL